MKKIIFALFPTVLFGLLSCAQATNEKIGINDNGVFKITSSLDKIKSDWSILLKNQKNETDLVSFEILSGVDSEVNNEVYYYLLGKNKTNTTKMATLLTLQDGDFFLLGDEGFAPTGTVTCTGCSYGCNPEKIGKKWYCDANCGTNCTKTVTVTTQ